MPAILLSVARFALVVLAAGGLLGVARRPTMRFRRKSARCSSATTVDHYTRFEIPKKSGGRRLISSPKPKMRVAQSWIAENVLDLLSPSRHAMAFRPGTSIVDNASPHLNAAIVVKLDLKDFFPSITFPRVKGIFQDLGFSPAVATILGLLCTECPRRKVEHAGKTLHVATGPRGLPQGACTSPALSNLLARRLDARLEGLAKKLGFAYTRYADDLTFSPSGEAVAKTAYLLARVRHIVAEENLVVNEKKTRVQRPGRRQSVTGIVVNQRPNVPRRTETKEFWQIISLPAIDYLWTDVIMKV